MEDLSTAIGVISVLLEVLRQSGEISGESAPVTVEIVQMQSIRSSTREQRIPAGCTQGLLKIQYICVLLGPHINDHRLPTWL